MGQIIRSGECKNSPKNAVMEAIAIEVFDATNDRIIERLAEDVTLHLADGAVIEGNEATNRYIAEHVQRSFEVLRVDHAITHGRIGAANGLLTTATDQTGFCIVVEFVNAKAERLQAIKLYGV